jgi:hypothetical protein
VRAPAREGRYAARFEVDPGDGPGGYGMGERAEALIDTRETDCYEGHESWWGWSVYFPPDFQIGTSPWASWTQFHNSGTSGATNAFFYVANASTLMFGAAGGDAAHPVRRDWTLAPLLRGNWYDIVFHVKWSSSATDGFVEVWVNGTRVVAKTVMATLYAGQTCYLKQGIYRAPYDKPSVIYIDGTVRGQSYDDVETRASAAASATLTTPFVAFTREPRVLPGRQVRVAARTWPRRKINIIVRDRRGRLLGLLRTRANRNGLVNARVRTRGWKTQRRLRLVLWATGSHWTRERHRTFNVSARQLQLASLRPR